MSSFISRQGSLKPEDQLILLCARIQLAPEMEQRIMPLLTTNLDWSYIINKAHAHRVYPLLYNTLRHFNDDLVPEVILSKLKTDYYQNGVRNLLNKQELLRLLRRFQEHGIPVMPIKGPTLAESVYGNLLLRVFSDLDILIPVPEVLKAKEVLLALGYHPEFSLSPAQEQIYLRSNCEYNFDRRSEDGTAFHVEVHGNVVPRFVSVPLDSELIWRNASKTTFDGAPIYQMSPKNQFLALCLHAWKHFWTPLQWICDLNEFLGCYQESLNWDDILAHTQSLRIEKIVSTSLSLVDSLLIHETSDALDLSPARRFFSLSLPPLVQRHIFPNDESISSNVQRHWFYLRFRSSLRDRLKYFLLVLATPTPTDFKELGLAARYSFLYWLIRPFRVVWKVLRGRQRL